MSWIAVGVVGGTAVAGVATAAATKNGFRVGGLQTRSVLSPEQEQLLGPLADYVRQLLSADMGQQDALTTALLRSTTNESKDMAQTIFSDALLGPAMRSYDRDVAPKIAGDFASFGGTLSTRRDETINRGRTEVVNQAQASLAGLLPQIESFPLQQTLGQIQGLGSLQTQRLAPFHEALSFALQPTRSLGTQTPGPGWAMLSNGLSGVAAGGTAAAGASAV